MTYLFLLTTGERQQGAMNQGCAAKIITAGSHIQMQTKHFLIHLVSRMERKFIISFLLFLLYIDTMATDGILHQKKMMDRVCSIGGIMNDRTEPKNLEKNISQFHFVLTYPTQGFNLDLQSENQATNSLSFARSFISLNHFNCAGFASRAQFSYVLNV